MSEPTNQENEINSDPGDAEQIRRQQEEWDTLGEEEQNEVIGKHEELELEDTDEEDSAAIIKEHLAQHNENKKNPAYLVRGAELMCSQGSNKRMMNLSPCHGVYIKMHAVVHELDCISGEGKNITWFGVCTPGEGLETETIKLFADNETECQGKKCEPHIIGTWMETHEETRIVDNGDKLPSEGEDAEGCNTLTMDSFLVCKYGGIIMPITSGQEREVTAEEFDYETAEEKKAAFDRVSAGCTENIDREGGCDDLLHARIGDNESGNVHGSEFENEESEEENSSLDYGNVSQMSKEGLMALMELEILNEYSQKKGYLVIQDGKLIGIKPHLAGDGGITVGFGDYLMEDDLKFYQERGYHLSTNKDDFDDLKDTIIPVEICFEKCLLDVDHYYNSLDEQMRNKELRSLSQQEMDALIIAKYQCNALGEEIRDKINEEAEREILSKAFEKKHGDNGSFESRTNVEMNIYFDGKYEVEGGLGGKISVKLWENLDE